MKPLIVYCVIFGILSNIAFIVGEDLPVIHGQLTRTAREANKQGAVDCQMGPWSNWTTCDPCSKKQFRSRTVEVFGQFQGLVCNQPLGERRACKTEQACTEDTSPPPCLSTEFQCDSGVCIKKRLVCNGDNDCGDFSDEECDNDPRRPCGNKEMELSELARTAGYGMSILGSGARANAFNNELFNGVCSRLKDPNTLEYHRTPWNVAVLRYDSSAEESYSREVFDTTSTLLKEIIEENSLSISLGLSYKFEPTEEMKTPFSPKAGVTLAYGRKEIIKKINEEKTTKNKSFMRVKGKVQMGTFRMKSRDLRMTETFLLDVSALPLEYAKGEYFRFLEEYGTHYATSGKAGGEYELVYVLNKEYMETKSVTSRDVQRCFSIDVSIDVQGVPGVEGNVGVKPGFCNDLMNKEGGVHDQNALIDKVMTSVRGGTIDTATALKTKIEKTGVMDVDAYVAWAKSLTVAPVLIDSQSEAIQSLIPLNMQHAEVKKDNLKRAYEDYISEYNVCKCKPCQNGGTVSLIDGECLCLCLPEFEGLACQNVKSDNLKYHEEKVVQQGNWGCWSSWTGCSGVQRTRTRSCNTEGLTGGTCKGEVLDTDYC
ncbi:complement component C9 [Conger conger]|uniref:complement component C9 n=1 Tax=Conger conger TaxID=82655 RepID=UPI002A59C57D|nr:complement component C9 [Conger conger]